ncbi:MAG: hypothetical protein OXN25_03170 [Candidatus Poribacteria bacterium]|nr:hypothetical protein [Candidatus Poribacteria bacterium]
MFIEIINPKGRHQTSYKGMVNITYIQQVKIIRAKNDSYEIHINLVDSPSIEFLGTKAECEETYKMLQRVLEKHEMSIAKKIVFPPPSKLSEQESEKKQNA